MRFLTFLKQVPEDEADENMLIFKAWYMGSDFGKKNPHGGLPQIRLYVMTAQADPKVWDGFLKWEGKYNTATKH